MPLSSFYYELLSAPRSIIAGRNIHYTTPRRFCQEKKCIKMLMSDSQNSYLIFLKKYGIIYYRKGKINKREHLER